MYGVDWGKIKRQYQMITYQYNDGVTQVQDNLNTVGDSAFNDFDQKIVTGTQVTSGYTNFEGKSVAILIATQSAKNASENAVVTELKGAGCEGTSANPGIKMLMTAYSQESTGKAEPGDVFPTTKADGSTAVALHYVNYNAVLLGSDKGNTSGAAGAGDKASSMYFDNGTWRTNAGFATKNGKVLFNNKKSNISKSGMLEYVPSSAKFQSNLIKDASGTVLGIAFEQIGAK